MTQLSTGDLFRSAIQNKTDLGMQAEKFMEKGQLVPDHVVISMVQEVLSSGVKNFILDGFPRTVAQAIALDQLLEKLNLNIGRAVFLDVPIVVLEERLTGRRVCRKCTSVYHVINKAPKVSGVCDSCGGEVIQRNDDKIEVIKARLEAYKEFTAPLKEYYKSSGKYIEVNGNRETEEVYKEIEKIII